MTGYGYPALEGLQRGTSSRGLWVEGSDSLLLPHVDDRMLIFSVGTSRDLAPDTCSYILHPALSCWAPLSAADCSGPRCSSILSCGLAALRLQVSINDCSVLDVGACDDRAPFRYARRSPPVECDLDLLPAVGKRTVAPGRLRLRRLLERLGWSPAPAREDPSA